MDYLEHVKGFERKENKYFKNKLIFGSIKLNSKENYIRNELALKVLIFLTFNCIKNERN